MIENSAKQYVLDYLDHKDNLDYYGNRKFNTIQDMIEYYGDFIYESPLGSHKEGTLLYCIQEINEHFIGFKWLAPHKPLTTLQDLEWSFDEDSLIFVESFKIPEDGLSNN